MAAVADNKAKAIKSERNSVVAKSTSQERILRKRGYTLGRILGEGSYAKVYLADYEDLKTGKKQKLACKLINGSSAPKDFLRKFFPREVEIMSKVIHQYIIRVHSILQRRQKYYIFMQYAENGDLLEFIRTNGPVRERQARIWFGQVVKGLKYLHDRDIAHRDMKCENLLLTSAYNIKISDFGFARYTVDDNGLQVLSETFCGSVSYAPPEIIRGHAYNCKRADVWSIGVVLYIMLNKSMPFDDSNLRKLYEAQTNRTWKIRTKLKDVLSTEVKQFLHVLLEPVPDKRKTADQIWAYPWVQSSSSPDVRAKASPPESRLQEVKKEQSTHSGHLPKDQTAPIDTDHSRHSGPKESVALEREKSFYNNATPPHSAHAGPSMKAKSGVNVEHQRKEESHSHDINASNEVRTYTVRAQGEDSNPKIHSEKSGFSHDHEKKPEPTTETVREVIED